MTATAYSCYKLGANFSTKTHSAVSYVWSMDQHAFEYFTCYSDFYITISMTRCWNKK